MSAYEVMVAEMSERLAEVHRDRGAEMARRFLQWREDNKRWRAALLRQSVEVAQ